MRHVVLVLALAVAVFPNAHAAENESSIPSTEDERFAYAYGFSIQQYLATLKLSEREMGYLLRALSQSASGEKPIVAIEDYSSQKLQAWIEKRRASGTASLASSTEGKGDSALCKLYQELTTHPDLKDFPVVVDKLENGYATLVGVTHSRWAKLGGVDMSSAFAKIEMHGKKAKLAQGVAQRVTGKEAAWREYSTASTEEVRTWGQERMRIACSGN